MTEIWANISSGNGLLPDANKPLPGPMLASHRLVQCYLPDSNFTESALATFLCNDFENYTFKIIVASPRG